MMPVTDTMTAWLHGAARKALPALPALLLCGCLGPAASRPESPLPTPEAWATPVQAAVRADIAGWWAGFKDPELDALIAATLDGNLELAAARARVTALRARAVVAGSARLPVVGATGEGGLLRDDLFTGRFGLPDQERAGYQAGFDASWEIDLFGGIDARTRAAAADAEAAALSAADLAITLTAETARGWLELRGLRARLQILERRIQTEQERRGLLADRVRAGLATDAELAMVEADLATLESALPTLAEELARTRYALAVLTGRPPAASVVREPGDGLPAAPAIPEPGLPAELLARRPDVRTALVRLVAAGARVDSARADRYPRLMLTGLLGMNGEESRSFSIGPGLIYQLLPRVSLPIFNAGALAAEVEGRRADEEVARRTWGQVMLRALEDVESALTGVSRERERLGATRRALEQARLAERLAAARERGGLEDYFPVLDARRRAWELEDAGMQSAVRLLTQTVALYKALGGGWTSGPESGPESGSESGSEQAVDERATGQPARQLAQAPGGSS
jgi:NodT family efflux transporter outer membrane factor (OMF) lipoprotein